MRVRKRQFGVFLWSRANCRLWTIKPCILNTVKPTASCSAYGQNGHTVQVHITSQLSIISLGIPNFFWRTRQYKSIYNLKIDTIEMLIHHSIDAFYFSFKTMYDMSCHLLTEN
jgi:hypothetical protein